MFKKILFVFLFFFISISSCYATFLATPMKFELTLGPEEQQQYSILITNKGDETLRIKLYLNDFKIEPNGQENFLEPGTLERSCAPWITLNTDELEIEPGQNKSVQFQMSVPKDKQGTYWTMIFIEQITNPGVLEKQEGAKQFSIMTYQRIGIRIYEDTPNAEKESSIIDLVQIVKDPTTNASHINVGIKNEGKVLLKCSGHIEITNENGDTVEKIEIEPFNLYAQSNRILDHVVTKNLSPGLYTILAVIDDSNEDLVAGEAQFKVE